MRRRRGRCILALLQRAQRTRMLRVNPQHLTQTGNPFGGRIHGGSQPQPGGVVIAVELCGLPQQIARGGAISSFERGCSLLGENAHGDAPAVGRADWQLMAVVEINRHTLAFVW